MTTKPTTKIDAGALKALPSLAAAIVQAQAASRPVKPDGKHHQGYKYASAEAVVTEARRALNEAGLALVLMSQSSHVPEGSDAPSIIYHRKGQDPEEHALWLLDLEYALIHESGEMLCVVLTGVPVVPGPGRPPDRALSAALTAAHKYALIHLLALPRNDGEVSDRNDEGARSSRRSTATKGGLRTNKHPGTCVDCKETVEPEDGFIRRDEDLDEWRTIHATCLKARKSPPGSPTECEACGEAAVPAGADHCKACGAVQGQRRLSEVAS